MRALFRWLHLFCSHQDVDRLPPPESLRQTSDFALYCRRIVTHRWRQIPDETLEKLTGVSLRKRG